MPWSVPAENPTATMSRPETIAPMLGMKANSPVRRPSRAAMGTPPAHSMKKVKTPSTTMPTSRPNNRRRKVKPTAEAIS